jgi:outer membrane protein, multidrug efflux system
MRAMSPTDEGEGRGQGRRLANLILIVCGALLIIGCALKPPPSATDIRKQSETLAGLDLSVPWKAASVSTGAIGDNWLASFGDDQLNALVAEALKRNPDLAVASTKVEQAGQYVEMAKAALRPSFNIFGIGGINLGGGDISSALQGISLGVSWEPDLWGRMRYGREAASSTYASAQADFEFARQSLAATVAKSWFTASETWLQIQINEQKIEAAQIIVTLTEKRLQTGAGTEQDVALARVNLASLKDYAKQVRFAHSQALRALELLLGRYPAAEISTRKDLTQLPGDLPAGLPLEMLERRPDMIAAERRVAAAFNRVGEAKAAMLPRLILNANIAALNSDVLSFKEDYKNPSAGAGVKLVAPVYQGGALKTQVQIRTLEQKEAVTQYAAMAMRALGDVENSLAAGQSLLERRSFLQQAVAENQRALDLVRISYRIGRTDLRAVEQQQLSLHSAHLGLLRVQSEQLTQRVNLYLALGGSFENLPAQPATVATIKSSSFPNDDVSHEGRQK